MNDNRYPDNAPTYEHRCVGKKSTLSNKYEFCFVINYFSNKCNENTLPFSYL